MLGLPVADSTLPLNVRWNKYLREINHPLGGGVGWKGSFYKRGRDPSEQRSRPRD